MPTIFIGVNRSIRKNTEITSTRIGPSVAMIEASIGLVCWMPTIRNSFFATPHQYGCPDEFYDVSFALHPFDRNEKERQQSQDRGDTYRQGRQCVRRHVLRHNHLVKRVIHRPDQIGQDQAEVGLGLILQCVHGWMIDSWGINSQKTRREYQENDAPSLGTAPSVFF